MRQRFDFTQFFDSMFENKIKYRPFVHTLTADNFQITTEMPPFLVLDPDGSKDVLLPAEADSLGLQFIILNNASGSETITVKDDADSSTIASIAQNGAAIVWCDGTTWYGFPLNSSVAASVATLAVTGAATVGTIIDGSPQSLSGAGAVDVTSLITFVTTTSADALTLADGTTGQIKIIVMVVDGGDGTLTPSNFGNGTTLTFDDAGDYAVLVFDGTNWWVVSSTATIA